MLVTGSDYEPKSGRQEIPERSHLKGEARAEFHPPGGLGCERLPKTRGRKHRIA